VQFQKDLSSRRGDTAENVLVLLVKCPLLLTDQNRTYTTCSACAVSDRYVDSDIYQRLDTAEKLLCPSSKVPFVIGQLKTKLIPIVAHAQ
jgi:hypothetical protein